ncbi:hypothetical protein RJ639_009844 [Escallonia herrerae]|uniref:Uncharacterized protein n=1 Tax=Escallonia herrerae TaxID=1293975 RepID=A0AA88VPV2_9ASTE|nr:hypothetical protein RJ639_009844 [Escallonia herrerae]
MEDIEDLLVGGIGGGAPPGFRLPVTASVGVKPKTKKRFPVQDLLTPHHSPKIPGTQTIYMKTFGCSHNQVTVYAYSFFITWNYNGI